REFDPLPATSPVPMTLTDFTSRVRQDRERAVDVIEATIVSGALLLVFELAIIYKLLLSTRDFTRTIDSFKPGASRRARETPVAWINRSPGLTGTSAAPEP
ncbi:hypothetical protein ABZS63_18245, partial [Streptomyces sp. NPDC005568]